MDQRPWPSNESSRKGSETEPASPDLPDSDCPEVVASSGLDILNITDLQQPLSVPRFLISLARQQFPSLSNPLNIPIDFVFFTSPKMGFTDLNQDAGLTGESL